VKGTIFKLISILSLVFVIAWDNRSVIIDGGSDETSIGNTLDRLHVQCKIRGRDGFHDVDVINDGGVRKLAVLATTIVEQIFGQPASAAGFFYIGATAEDADGVGSVNSNVRVEIPAAVSPLDDDYPAVDVYTSVTAAIVNNTNPERALATQICINLNSDPDFRLAWRCDVLKNHSGVFIEARIFNEFGERTTWTVTAGGDTVINQATDNITRAGSSTQLVRSPDDKRIGVLNIEGSVSVTPGSLSDQYEAHLMTNANSDDMHIDGSSAQQSFWIHCDDDFDQFVTEIRIYCTDNGIKTTLFCAAPAATNGLLVNIKSDGEATQFTDHPIMDSGDFLFHVSVPVSNFRMDFNPATDILIGARSYPNPFPIRKCGSSINGDDFIQAIVRDNFSSIQKLHMIVRGFKREP